MKQMTFPLSHIRFSVQKEKAIQQKYIWSHSMKILFTKTASVISGNSGPLVLTVQKTDSGYNLKEYWTPSMGADYSRSIKERFPLSLQYNAIGSSKYADELKKKIF